MSHGLEPKASTAVNKALAACALTIAQNCSSPGITGCAPFAPPDSPGRKCFGPCSLRKNENGRSVSMHQGLSAPDERGLTKRFDRTAVDALNLTVRAGQFYPLVGADGDRKTTKLW